MSNLSNLIGKLFGRESVHEVSRESMFVINQVNYYKHYAQFYVQKQHFTPSFLLQIPVILPFYVPFNNGTNTTFILDDGQSACTLHFAPVRTTESVSPGIITQHVLNVPVVRSRVEMVYLSAAPIEINSSDDVTSYFDEMLHYLNLIILSYQITFKDLDAHRVSREMLQFSALFRLIKLDPWTEVLANLFLMHTNVPTDKTPVSREKEGEIVWYASVLNQKWNPFMLSEEFALAARRSLAHGFYREAVIQSQTSIETFLDTLLMQLLMTEGKTASEADVILEALPFISIVKKQFHPRVSGNWDPSQSSTEVGQWFSNSYNLRNKVAHEGYYPKFAESEQAIDSSERFRAYILNLLRAKKSKYPNIVRFFDK